MKQQSFILWPRRAGELIGIHWAEASLRFPFLSGIFSLVSLSGHKGVPGSSSSPTGCTLAKVRTSVLAQTCHR